MMFHLFRELKCQWNYLYSLVWLANWNIAVIEEGVSFDEMCKCTDHLSNRFVQQGFVVILPDGLAGLEQKEQK